MFSAFSRLRFSRGELRQRVSPSQHERFEGGLPVLSAFFRMSHGLQSGTEGTYQGRF